MIDSEKEMSLEVSLRNAKVVGSIPASGNFFFEKID